MLFILDFPYIKIANWQILCDNYVRRCRIDRLVQNLMHLRFSIYWKFIFFVFSCNSIGASLSILLVHWTGKRPLVFVSLIGVAFCFCASATYAYFIDSIPGVGVENVVANYSMENLDRSSYINEHNLTEALSLTSVLETTTEFIDSANASESITQATTHLLNSSTTENTNKIFLAIPHADRNPYSWLPMTLLIASGIFSHIGKHARTSKT